MEDIIKHLVQANTQQQQAHAEAVQVQQETNQWFIVHNSKQNIQLSSANTQLCLPARPSDVSGRNRTTGQDKTFGCGVLQLSSTEVNGDELEVDEEEENINATPSYDTNSNTNCCSLTLSSGLVVGGLDCDFREILDIDYSDYRGSTRGFGPSPEDMDYPLFFPDYVPASLFIKELQTPEYVKAAKDVDEEDEEPEVRTIEDIELDLPDRAWKKAVKTAPRAFRPFKFPPSEWRPSLETIWEVDEEEDEEEAVVVIVPRRSSSRRSRFLSRLRSLFCCCCDIEDN
ncbi:uncharacterized protein [Dendropsophus ebraccatus]|uniref:uncharacterized protein n=1 Tax=Dendropsophus ebraccatus TaxID=150705 RepID=UPI0038311E31